MSDILKALEPYRERFITLRRELHAIPETAYEEHKTSALVAEELSSYGLEVQRGWAQTGVVGVLRGGSSDASIALRADIDALAIAEENSFSYRSTQPGKMHACGHDGHTAMLLLAAKYLSETRNFDGTAVFIFQPAEEGGGGGRKLVEEGFFESFPVQGIYGLHNIPELSVGAFAVKPGPMMAAADAFKIVLTGPGGHAALPHETSDPIVAGSDLVLQLQTLVSRNLEALEPAVLSVTHFHSGEVNNVIPTTATLRGTVRAYSDEARALLEAGIKRVAEGIGKSYGLEAKAQYWRGYPATVNTPAEAFKAQEVLRNLIGDKLLTEFKPLMASEDFAFLLQACPGAYVWLGNGETPKLHTPRYDFNDESLTFGAAFWVRLVETVLKSSGRTRAETLSAANEVLT
jgi:amidohydrolase